MGAPWLASAIETAGAALGALDLLVDVQHEAWIDADDTGKPEYDDAVTLKAMVQVGTSQERTVQGEEIRPRACLSFFAPIEPNGADGRFEPIDPRDRLTFTVDGVTYDGQPIVDAVGSQLINQGGSPATATRPVLTVWLR